MKLTSPRFPSSVTVAPAFLLVALLGLRFQVSAQVIMDGTLGRPLALSGPAFLVTPDLGRQVGGNLFHSFSKLNLVAGESAIFSGPANVQNVLARVTGGASSIDGTLRSTIAGANLYLLNPRGVMFGPNARVDVSGSFVVSTADYVKLADGGRFDARLPADSSLTAAPLAKFGFLSMAPAKITVDRSQLAVPNGQTLTLVGGDLELKNGALVKAPHGTVNLTSVGAVTTEISAAPALTDLPTGGTITLSTGASVDVSGEGGGLVVIRSRDLTVDNASVRANTTGGLDGRGIDVQLGGAGVLQNGGLISAQTSGSGKAGDVIVRVAGLLQVLNLGSISTDTFGAGKGGKVDVTAGALTVAGGTSPHFTFISSDSNPGATGSAGDVTVEVSGLLKVLTGGSITSDTSGSGQAGKVKITAGALTIDGGAYPDFTGISSETLVNPMGSARPTGSAGDVTVVVTGLLRVLNGGKISSTTSGSGDAGTVEITAGTLTIDGGTRDLTGIASDSKAGATGPAGDLTIEVGGLLKVLNGGRIDSDTSGRGTAGQVRIKAGALTIDGGTSSFDTFISSDSNPGATGPAGDVKVQVTRWLQVLNGGTITSDTSGSGSAGKVTITAGALTIDGGTRPAFTGISSETLLKPTGSAGDVAVRVTGLLQVLNGGKISSTTSGSGTAGTVAITADELTIDGGTRDRTGISSGSKAGATGNGGELTIVVGGLLQVLNGGRIESDTSGRGDAGKVGITAGTLTIDGGTRDLTGISSDSKAGATGNGGDLTIVVGGPLQVLNGGRIESDTSGRGNAGKVGITAGTLTIDGGISSIDTYISSDSNSRATGPAGDVKVQVTRLLLLLNGGTITSDTSGSGRAGTVDIAAGALTIDGGIRPDFTGISSETLLQPTGSLFKPKGSAGDVILRVTGLLQVLNGGKISSATSGSGDAGTAEITAGALTIDGGTRDLTHPEFTGISSDSKAGATGNAGDLTVHVGGLLQMFNGGKISSTTSGSGNAGRVAVTAGTMTLLGSDDVRLTGVFSDSDEQATGNAGQVAVTVTGRLLLQNGGRIATSTAGAGDAGEVTVTAGTLTLNGEGLNSNDALTGIASNGALGKGGNVAVTVANLLQILNGAEISADATGAGKAGKVGVTAGALIVDGGTSPNFTGISSETAEEATGNSGEVNVVVAGLLQILNGGQISTDTKGSGDAGKLTVRAGALRIEGDSSGFFTGISSASNKKATGNAGNVNVQATGAILLRDHSSISSKSALSSAGDVVVQAGTRLDLYHSAITTEANHGNGGELRLTATERIHLDHSQIFSKAGGSGGDIFIDPVTVSLNQSTISANALTGNGGNITINTGFLLRSQDSQITASSQFGVNGQISVLGPSVDLSGSLITLPGGLLAAESRLPERCAVRLPGNLSSFISVGRGGLPLEPQDYQPMFLLLDEQMENREKRP